MRLPAKSYNNYYMHALPLGKTIDPILLQLHNTMELVTVSICCLVDLSITRWFSRRVRIRTHSQNPTYSTLCRMVEEKDSFLAFSPKEKTLLSWWIMISTYQNSSNFVIIEF